MTCICFLPGYLVKLEVYIFVPNVVLLVSLTVNLLLVGPAYVIFVNFVYPVYGYRDRLQFETTLRCLSKTHSVPIILNMFKCKSF